MRFYRLHHTYEHGSSAGYSWFTSRRAAEQQRQKDLEEDPGEDPGIIDEVDITPTKAGILEALTRYATYPDNG